MIQPNDSNLPWVNDLHKAAFFFYYLTDTSRTGSNFMWKKSESHFVNVINSYNSRTEHFELIEAITGLFYLMEKYSWTFNCMN